MIRTNERSAVGDPLKEFPKGNSLRRLKGAFVCPRVGCALLKQINKCAALFEAVSADSPWRALDHSSGVNLLRAGAQIQSAPETRCSPPFAGNQQQRILCVRNV